MERVVALSPKLHAVRARHGFPGTPGLDVAQKLLGRKLIENTRGPLCSRGDPLRSRPRPLHEGDPRRQREERSHRFRQDRTGRLRCVMKEGALLGPISEFLRGRSLLE